MRVVAIASHHGSIQSIKPLFSVFAHSMYPPRRQSNLSILFKMSPPMKMLDRIGRFCFSACSIFGIVFHPLPASSEVVNTRLLVETVQNLWQTDAAKLAIGDREVWEAGYSATFLGNRCLKSSKLSTSTVHFKKGSRLSISVDLYTNNNTNKYTPVCCITCHVEAIQWNSIHV